MAWDDLTGDFLADRTTSDNYSAADFNTLNDQIQALWENIKLLGGNGASQPSSDIETLVADTGFLTGDIKPTLAATAHTGWLMCNRDTLGNAGSGATQANDNYGDLFDLVKTGWGNAGTEVFSNGDTVYLPDFRGAVLCGAGSHGTETMANGSAYNGGSVGDYDDDQMQQITGEMSTRPTSDGSLVFNSDGALTITSGSDTSTVTYNATAGARHEVSFDSSDSTAAGGARTGNNTKPFTASVNWMIKI